MAKPIVCEYFIQNDMNETDLKSNPYPNIFILPKKYASVSDVRLSEVIEAFPLVYADPNSNYVLRFETSLQISQSKRLTVWQDIDPAQDIAVPHNKEKIRIKALRLPKGINTNSLVKQPRQQYKPEQQSRSQRTSALNTENQNVFEPEIQQQVKGKDSRMSFPDLGSVFSRFGGLFEDKGGKKSQKSQNQQQQDIFDYQSHQQQQQDIYNVNEDILTHQKLNQQQQQHQQQNLIIDHNEDEEAEDTQPNAWDTINYQKVQDNANHKQQTTNLLFTEDDDDSYQQQNQQNLFEPNNSNPYNNGPSEKQNSDGFDIFNTSPNVHQQKQQTQQNQQPSIFGNDLFDLNFSDPAPAHSTPQSQSSFTLDPSLAAGFQQQTQVNSKIDDVKDIFKKQAQQKEEWHAAYAKHEDRINNWVGKGPMKNHIRVLLCTLQDVLWPNNGWQRVGMDKLLDPQEVKKYYRKATMLCHPDKLRNCENEPDKVYIANRCFAAITEAYNIFKKEEGIQ